MYKIQFCDLDLISDVRGNIKRVPVESDWKDLIDYIFTNEDEANRERIELYKRGDGYYRVVRVEGIMIMKIVEQTMADGPGLRTSVYCAGCYHNCPNCHNPQTHDINNGIYVSMDDLVKKLLDDPCNGITFSGGDPLYQVDEFTELAKRIKQQSDKNIWLYTGFMYEQIKQSPKLRQILDYIDIVVDGPYIDHLKTDKISFRGSKNQRIIDVMTDTDISDLYDVCI